MVRGEPLVHRVDRGHGAGPRDVAPDTVQSAHPELAGLTQFQRGDLLFGQGEAELGLRHGPSAARVILEQPAIVGADPDPAVLVLLQAPDEVAGELPVLHGDGAIHRALATQDHDPVVRSEPGASLAVLQHGPHAWVGQSIRFTEAHEALPLEDVQPVVVGADQQVPLPVAADAAHETGVQAIARVERAHFIPVDAGQPSVQRAHPGPLPGILTEAEHGLTAQPGGDVIAYRGRAIGRQPESATPDGAHPQVSRAVLKERREAEYLWYAGHVQGLEPGSVPGDQDRSTVLHEA